MAKSNTKDPMDEEYLVLKRIPLWMPRRRNDYYVTRRTDFKAQLSRCQTYFDNGGRELFVHGLGAAINRAINLSLQLQSNGNGTIGIAVRTSTVDLVDDLEPLNPELAPEFQTRSNSAVHIRVFRIKPASMLAAEQSTSALS